MFLSVPIRSSQVFSEQMQNVDSVIRLGRQNVFPSLQCYTDVHAVPPLPPRQMDTPAGSSAAHAALQVANTTKSTRKTSPEESAAGKNKNSQFGNNSVQPHNKAKSNGKKVPTENCASKVSSATVQIQSPTEHPAAESVPVIATTQSQSQLSVFVDDNFHIIAFQYEDHLPTLDAGKRKHDNIRHCHMFEGPWPESLNWSLHPGKLNNGTSITVVEEPDVTSSQISDHTRLKRTRVEIPSATSDIGAQPDYLNRVFRSTSVSEAQHQACT